MKTKLTASLLLALAFSVGALSQNIATTRDAAINIEPDPPKIPRVDNSDVKRKRAYPMQPPTIPHKIDNYQVDLNANKCMSCHSRRQTPDSQAPMVSVTHYMDRDGNFLADISSRRYFCNQCHVVQLDVKPQLNNEFVDIDELLRSARD
ncbi:nitrate reductase cytochrome c-type subunit [Seongchinamella unica]|uniref:Periplasmic nitrate reductase, electron transfer subunit n=1 Tax=Seongchinamella unica TaxID=2547392 RepID=A0A4R5LPY0_9GAMM|nr:nitrate reductase cytochrome c-type subunit [Seongchinamella unica]TDG12624.1 nitrate reductase cytochrome c-type subunit [Seongchinamella unica]